MNRIFYALLCLLLAPNSGRSQWQLIDTISNANFMNIHFFDNANGIISGEMDGRFLKTNNGGLSWDTIQVPFLDATTDQLFDMQFVDHNIGFVCGGSPFTTVPNILMRTKDGGKTWDSTVVYTHPVYGFNGVDFKITGNDVEGIVFYYAGLIFKVTDTGRTLSNIVKPMFNLNIIDAVYLGNNTIVMAGYDHTSKIYSLFRSGDWGDNWDVVYKDSIAITSLGISGAYGLAGCGKGWILKSQDGGASWMKQKIAPDSLSFTRVKFGKNSYPYLLAQAAAGGGGYIYGSDNFGQSWHSTLVAMNEWFTDISMPSTQTGYVITNRKLYKTTTGGGLGLSVGKVAPGEAGIKIYPNPAFDRVTIDVPASMHVKTVTIYDAAGRVAIKTNSNWRNMDISSCARGVYLVEIDTGTETFKRKLLLK